jgi:hypothetical protein
MAQKQARLAREKQARGGKLPPWKQIGYKHNNTELNGDTAEAIVQLVDEALMIEGVPLRDLQEIRTQAKTAVLGFDKLRNAPRGSQEERAEANLIRASANDFYRRAYSLADQLDDRLGFDLWNRETWKKSDTPNSEL